MDRSELESRHPGRRDFLQTIGRASLGLAAAGIVGAGCRSRAGAAMLDPQAPLRIGVIGRQGHLYMVTNSLDKVPGAKIVACAFEDDDWEFYSDGAKRGGQAKAPESEPNWTLAQPWAGPGLKLYESYQQMLDKEKLDLAVVCLPYSRNAFAAAAAARAGVHVICEKPVAVNFEDLDLLDKAVKDSGVRLTAMFAMRYAPAIYTIRESVRAGSVGKVALARGQKSYKWGGERPWFYQYPEIYGSSILWVGIHAIDYIRWATGLEIVKVSAMHGNSCHPEYPGCQDHAVVNMQLADGATAAITLDYLRPESAPSHGDDRLRVIGAGGVVEKREIEEKVELIDSQGPRLLAIAEPPDFFADFIGELRGGPASLIGPDEAVRVTRICIAATRAAEQGQVLEV